MKRGGRWKKENEFYEEKEPRDVVEKGKKIFAGACWSRE